MRKRRIRSLVSAALAGAVLASGIPAGAAGSEAIYEIDNGGQPITAGVLKDELGFETGLSVRIREGGQEMDDGAAVGTGQTLALYDADGTLVRKERIAVRGDVTGAGSAEISQLSSIAEAVRGTRALEETAQRAADFDGSGKVDLTDLAQAVQQLREVQQEKDQQPQETAKPLYYIDPTNPFRTPLYFVDGHDDIPYISTATMRSALEKMLRLVGAHDLEHHEEDGITTFRRQKGSTAELDFRRGTITFSNFDSFLEAPYAAAILDPLNTSGLTEAQSAWYFRRPAGTFQRRGLPVVIDLAAHDIRTPHVGKTGYLPLQTFSDFFLTPFGFQAIYNGEMVGIIANGTVGELSDLYYAPTPRERSEALAKFNYDELCLALNNYYGLKEQHDVSDFASLFEQTGLRERLLSPDAAQSDTALYELAAGYLGDVHTSFLENSPYAGGNVSIMSDVVSPSVREYRKVRSELRAAREEAYPSGVPGYEEIGNTAYITIDRLTWDGTDYYAAGPVPDAPDTIGLVAYAQKQIMRENSPVKNVVLDLSLSGGGLTDAAIYVLAWYLGTARLDLNSTLTQGQASILYRADVNLDGKFDDKDSLTSLNRYCIISPTSFSCGNLIPAGLMADPRITLLGQATGGGACFLWNISTADGSVMQISGPIRTSVMQNGSYYDIDRGIRPDFRLASAESFYNRQELTTYINGLFR